MKMVRPLAFLAAALIVQLWFGISRVDAAAGYLYVAGFDTTSTTEASVNLPINAQTALPGEHSLFEMSMSNVPGATGNIIEIGITTDPSLNSDTNPHWFVSSWVNGNWKGYDGASDFVSNVGNFWTSSLAAYEGTSQTVSFQYSDSDWWLYLNGISEGYFPGSEWSGAFTTSLATEVFGEVYQNGTFDPTLNGSISGYNSSGGGHFSSFLVDAPYTISNKSGTGFTVSGPVVPEPSSLSLLGAVVFLGAVRKNPADDNTSKPSPIRSPWETKSRQIVKGCCLLKSLVLRRASILMVNGIGFCHEPTPIRHSTAHSRWQCSSIA